jgi:hypothetical protein
MKQNDVKLRTFLHTVIPPIGELELKRDLWADMGNRLNTKILTVPWFDYALVGLLGGLVLFYPKTILHLLYHL